MSERCISTPGRGTGISSPGEVYIGFAPTANLHTSPSGEVAMMDFSIQRLGGWEVDFAREGSTRWRFWARKPEDKNIKRSAWHWTNADTLRNAGFDLPRTNAASWEVQWDHPDNTGTHLMARNLNAHLPQAREWHLTPSGYLRRVGIQTPSFDAAGWEVDWSDRKGKKVLARNPHSKSIPARDWHYVDQTTLNKAGVNWRPKNYKTGRRKNAAGYIELSRLALSPQDIEIVDKNDLWTGKTRGKYVFEHRLVAFKKYGNVSGMVVRHINGIKDDNRPENLVLGSIRDNNLDHMNARLEMLYWRERCLKAEEKLKLLEDLPR